MSAMTGAAKAAARRILRMVIIWFSLVGPMTVECDRAETIRPVLGNTGLRGVLWLDFKGFEATRRRKFVAHAGGKLEVRPWPIISHKP